MRKGFAPIVIVLVLAGLLVAAGVWYYENKSSTVTTTIQNPTSTSQSSPQLITAKDFVGSWKGVEGKSSVEEIDFDADGAYRIYAYNPHLQLTRLNESGKWTFKNAELSLESDANAALNVTYTNSSIEGDTLRLTNKDDNVEEVWKRFFSNETSQKVEGCFITPYKQGALEFGDMVTDLRGGATCTYKINPSLPVFVFHLVGDPELNTIDRIEITKGNGKTVVQTLDVGMAESPYRDAKFFDAEDVNFDGYLDIKMMTFWGATGNTGYSYWLFDPSKSLFVPNKDLSGLSNPMPHPDSKTITTDSVGGMAGRIYNNATYKFDDNGKLILIRVEKQDWIEDKNYFLKTTSELRNGVMTVISTEIVKSDNF